MGIQEKNFLSDNRLECCFGFHGFGPPKGSWVETLVPITVSLHAAIAILGLAPFDAALPQVWYMTVANWPCGGWSYGRQSDLLNPVNPCMRVLASKRREPLSLASWLSCVLCLSPMLPTCCYPLRCDPARWTFTSESKSMRLPDLGPPSSKLGATANHCAF